MADNSKAAPAPKENMGQPIARYEARQKVTGGKIYAADLPVPGKKAYAWMVTSTIAKGRITAIDATAAKAVPGVLMVMTHENRPPLGDIKSFVKGGMFVTDNNTLSGPGIDHEGQPVALVVADTFEAAREAAHKVKVAYAAETPSATFEVPGATTKNLTEINPMHKPLRFNDTKAALDGSAHRIDAEYSTPIQHHNSMELYSTTAYWDDGKLVLHEPSQFVWGLRKGAASQLQVDEDHVRVTSPFVGGAFGGKGGITVRTALAALAARQLKRPVELVATRSQGFTISGNRQETRHKVSLGCDANGKLTGYDHREWEFTSRVTPYNNAGLDNCAAMYAFGAVSTENHIVQGDRNVPNFMRSPPELPNIYALESAMNELAAAAKIDPVAFRKLNDTRVNVTNGAPYTSRSVNECWDAAAASFGWDKRNPEPGSMRDGDWLIGWGCAMATYPTQMSPSAAKIVLRRNGTALIEVAAHDVGTGCYTIAAQAAGERLGIDPSRITVQMGDSRLPPGPIAGGSISTASVTSAICDGCDRLLASLGLTAEDARASDSADRLRAALDKSGRPEAEATGAWAPMGAPEDAIDRLYKGGLVFAGGAGEERTMFAFGAEMVEVRINARTREIRVPRMTGAFAAGRIMNPRTAHSQYMGGMIWGMGSALLEATEIDTKRARYTNDNLAEYHVAVNADIPAIDIIMVPEVDKEINVLGVKGIGELANVGTAAAITDAVWHATGKRVRDLPVTIDKII
ncbi:xanthine dehydrogenase family protein molybdopterin-binding subunit [Novosphingopyxis sp.]|uniref:xanthine dehydrogenase family protein molybdopterin-binding subunit n=1 Tax=Novosphingopyxis sp. TaxID=2709690 RepID=UPI003B595D39